VTKAALPHAITTIHDFAVLQQMLHGIPTPLFDLVGSPSLAGRAPSGHDFLSSRIGAKK